MSTHFHEHHEAILRWTWKLFCVKWVRLLEYAAEEQRKEAERTREAEFRKLRYEHGM